MSKNLHKFINSCVKESISEGLMFEAEWAHEGDVRIETMYEQSKRFVALYYGKESIIRYTNENSSFDSDVVLLYT